MRVVSFPPPPPTHEKMCDGSALTNSTIGNRFDVEHGGGGSCCATLSRNVFVFFRGYQATRRKSITRSSGGVAQERAQLCSERQKSRRIDIFRRPATLIFLFPSLLRLTSCYCCY